MASSSKKIFSGVAWSIVANVVNALYGFIMIPILIKYFGKAEYGLIGLAQSVNAYMHLMDMGLTSTNVRFFSNWLAKGDESKVRKLFSTCSTFYGLIGLINSTVLIILYFFSDTLFNVTPQQNVILNQLLLILAVAAIVNWFTSCYNQIIQATENVAWTQKRLLVTKLLMVFVLILTVVFGFSITLYFFLTILCNWLVLPWVVRKIRAVTPCVSFMPHFDIAVFREILPYTLNVFSFSIFSFTFHNLRPVFLGMQGTVESVAEYKIILGIITVCSSVSSVFLSTLLPSSSKVIANNDSAAFKRIAYQGTKFIMVFTAFCVFGMLAICSDLLLVYVGEEFKNLIPWLNVFLFTLLANHVTGISSLILGGSNIRPLARMTAVSSVLALIVAWFLIPVNNIGGVAIATAIYSGGQLFFYYLYYWPKVMKIDSWDIFKTIFLPITLIGSTIWFTIRHLPHFQNHWINIFVFGGVFAVLYVISMFFYLDKKDKSFLFGLVKKK